MSWICRRCGAQKILQETFRLSHSVRRQRRAEIANFVKVGGTVKVAAEKFNVSLYTIRTACKEFHVSLWERKDKLVGISPVLGKGGILLVLKELMNPALSLKDVGEKLGLSTARVGQIYGLARLHDFPGLPLRRQGKRIRLVC